MSETPIYTKTQFENDLAALDPIPQGHFEQLPELLNAEDNPDVVALEGVVNQGIVFMRTWYGHDAERVIARKVGILPATYSRNKEGIEVKYPKNPFRYTTCTLQSPTSPKAMRAKVKPPTTLLICPLRAEYPSTPARLPKQEPSAT